jgi:hypothetical protein
MLLTGQEFAGSSFAVVRHGCGLVCCMGGGKAAAQGFSSHMLSHTYLTAIHTGMQVITATHLW